MKIHLRQVPPGETLHIEGEEDAGFVGLEEAGVQAAGPVSYTFDVGQSDGGIFAVGRVSVPVKMRCVKCLEWFDATVSVDNLALQKELDGREQVDLTPEVREDIQLVLPSYPRCDVEGGKTCPATFPLSPQDQEGTKWSGWDALDKIKTDH